MHTPTTPIPTPYPNDPVGLVLTCGSRDCQHTFEPDRDDLAAGRISCPLCQSWTFQAALVEPSTSGGEQ